MSDEDLSKIKRALHKLEEKEPIFSLCPPFPEKIKKITPREAMFSPSEEVDLDSAVGRILSSPAVSCPPAIPVVICGEEIQEEHLPIFNYYGIKKLFVKKETI